MRQRFLPDLRWLSTAALLCAMLSAAAVTHAKPPTRISYEDAYAIEIIGKLGRPVGELVNVRGRWAQAKDRSKASGIVFLVTHVDDKPLASPVEFEVVTPIGRPTKGFTRPQDLNQKSAAVEWDLRGHEFAHGEFGRSSPQALEEAGVQPVARTASFTIDFEYVTARAHSTQPVSSSESK